MPPRLKMSRKITGVCVTLLLTLTSVYAARRCLNCLNDLIDRCQSERTNIFELLYWFACEVDIDQYNNIHLTFDPNSGDYGSHRYRNQEGVLDPPPWGYQYYTVGNTHRDASRRLPSYVVNSQRENIAQNSARILVGVNAVGEVDQVYITQHYDPSENLGSVYDPNHTYRISTAFLRQLRKFKIDEIQRQADSQPIVFNYNISSDYFQEENEQFSSIHIDIPYSQSTQSDCPDFQPSCCSVAIVIIIFLMVIFSLFLNQRK